MYNNKRRTYKRYKRKKKDNNSCPKKLRIRKRKHCSAPKGSPLFGIKVELFLDDLQKIVASRLLGCSRLVYNKCLGFNTYWYKKKQEALKQNEEHPGSVPDDKIKSYDELTSIYIFNDVLNSLKQQDGYKFLNEVNQKVLQQVVRHLTKAFEDFFDPKQPEKKHPTFKKKSNDNSCEFNSQAFGGISGNRMNIVTGLQNILFKCSPEHMSYLNRYQQWIQKCTLTKTKSGRYFLSFNISDFREKRVHPKSTAFISDETRQILSQTAQDGDKHTVYVDNIDDCGDYLIVTDTETGEIVYKKAGAGDPGIKTKLFVSDGSAYENPHVYKKYHRREAMLQRRFAKKEKKSEELYGNTNPYNIPKNSPNAGRNREKARIKLAEHSEHMKNIRENDSQEITTDYVNKFDVVFMENACISGMMRNHKIARALQDAGIGELNIEIEYKCLFYGKVCIKADRWFPSSKTCNKCGFKNNELQLSDRIWICPNCGEVIIRDYNASRNLLEDGIRLYREALGDRFIVTHICVLNKEHCENMLYTATSEL